MMRKVLLDFKLTATPEQMQDYLAFKLEFPDYYGKNLDALYDSLTEIGEDTCIGVFETEKDGEAGRYLRMVKKVLRDAEEENPHLCVVFADLEENYGENEGLEL